MKVHIVAARSDLKENRIIARLSHALADGTGWTLSPRVDGGAYVNLFIPYLNRVTARVETRTAAWFTHRDESLPTKVDMWVKAAKQVTLRLTSARLYLPDLGQYGPARLVMPPLDREKFYPAPKAVRRRPIAGTSGWVYNWGRKGEGLLAELVRTPLGQTADWRAAGGGWPIPTELYPFKSLEEFYQGLDIYVSTSLIEGVGYGPLEALACGCKVVVPSNVGVFDDLPEGPGVRHYRAGDLADLTRAFGLALDDPADPEGLRALTTCYTQEAWVEGWRAAVESLAEKPSSPEGSEEEGAAATPDTRRVVAAATPARPVPGPGAPSSPPSWRTRAGLYVVAYGEPAREQARRCLDSFKRHNPGIPVALCAERPLGPEDRLIQAAEADIGARSQKVRIYDLAPAEWEYVLYLDADTETRGDLSPLFDWLARGYEWVACLNPGKFALASNMGRMDNTNECQETYDLWGGREMAQLAGGVFAFRRSDSTRRFFARWAAEWQEYGKRDQGALLRAYWHEPVRTLLLLPRVWNCVAQAAPGKPGRYVYPYDEPERASVIHYPMTARRWQGIVAERSDSPEAWARVRQWERSHGKVAVR